MKKILAVALVGIISISLLACRDDDNNKTSDEVASEQQEENDKGTDEDDGLELNNVPASITVRAGENFDADAWLNENDISATDSAGNIYECEVDTSNLDTDTEGEYVITINADKGSEDITSADVNVTVKEMSDSEVLAMTDIDSVDTSTMSEEDIYDLAVAYYDNGLYDNAITLLQEISDYKDSATYIDNSNLMLDYQGVYRPHFLKDGASGWYYVLSGNVLTGFDLTNEDEGVADVWPFEQILTEYKGEPALLDKVYANEDPENLRGHLYKVLTVDEDGNKCLRSEYIDSRYGESYDVISRETEEKLYERVYKALSKKAPSVGMTESEVVDSTWGEPDRINKTTYSWGTQEQWCYSNNRYVYLENGKVTAVSESE